MSDKKTSKNNAGNIATGIAMAASVLPLIKPAIDAVRDYTDKTIEERKKLVTVPELYSKEYPLSVDQAVEILESCGLKATLVKSSLIDADARYKDCFDTQVIKSQPKAKQKVERGASILVKYITQEVINKSIELNATAEKRKAEISYEKSIKQAERKEKTKRVVSNVLNTARQGVSKIPTVFYKASTENEEDCNEQKQ